MIPVVRAKLLEGKRGLVVGIANEQSIAWGCAKAFRAFGAELAVTYLNDKAKKYVEPLARELEASILMPLDVRTPGQMEAVFDRIAKDPAGPEQKRHRIEIAAQLLLTEFGNLLGERMQMQQLLDLVELVHDPVHLLHGDVLLCDFQLVVVKLLLQ